MWQQLAADTRFLTNLGIMDYSLLIGLYYVGVGNKEALHHRPPSKWQIAKGFVRQNGPHRNGNSNDLLLRGSAEWTSLHSSIWTEVADPEMDGDGHLQRTLEYDEDGVEMEAVNDGRNQGVDRGDGGWAASAMMEQFGDEKVEDEDRKLLQPQESFLRRRAFTSSSGLQRVSSTENTFRARIIEGPGYYSLGIIDILQEWDWSKKIERWFKVYFRCQDPYGISCIEPTLYRKRFLAKMLQIGIGRKNARV